MQGPVVGAGSGKSTALGALLRLAPIQRGSVTVDGVDVRSVPLQRLRRAVGVVPQHPLIFEGALLPPLPSRRSCLLQWI